MKEEGNPASPALRQWLDELDKVLEGEKDMGDAVEPVRERVWPRTLNVLIIGCAVVMILVGLFPPWVFRLPQGFVKNMGYSFLTTPPVLGTADYASVIDIPRLIVSWVVVAMIGVGFVFLQRKRKKV